MLKQTNCPLSFGHYKLFWIVFVLFALFVVFPVGYTLITAIFTGGSFVDNLLLLNKGTFLLLAKSFFISSAIALFSTLFGTVLGLLLYKTNVKYRGWFKIVLLIPLFISPYILAVAWKDFFFMFFNDTSFISSTVGVILVLSTIFSPLSMLIIGSALSNIDTQLEETGFVITKLHRVIFKITMCSLVIKKPVSSN